MSGQFQVSSQETNQVYAYSYHFQHNGTTNSKDILRTVLGVDPDFGIEPPGGQSIVKTFSSPNIRGFFTKGILPAGPVNHFSNGFGNRFNTNSAIDNIKKVVESNLKPPPNIANGLLTPISPDISNRFSDNFNNVNDIGVNFQKQDDFPKIPPPPPPFQNRDNFPNAPRIPPINLNDFPKIPDPIINNRGVSRVENFSRNTPDGGKIEGKIETFSYNPPPVSNSNSNFQENSQGFRRNENFVNNNQEVTGHRSQSYFKQHFRTITPNIESNDLIQNNQNKRIDNNNAGNGNNNQWWNVLNVLGRNNNNNNNINNNINNKNNNNINANVRNNGNLGRQIERNINEVKNNLNNQLSRQFGSRLSSFNNRQNVQTNQIGNREPRQNFNNGYNNQNRNFNNQFNGNNVFQNQQNPNIPLNNRMDSNHAHNNRQTNNAFQNIPIINNVLNNANNQPNNNQAGFNNQFNNNARINHNSNNAFGNQNNINNQFKNDDTTKKVMNIINDVNAQLNNLDNNAGGRNNNNFRLTWDDDIPQIFTNNDWSRRQSPGSDRPFSNAHSGPLTNQPGNKPIEMLKSSIDSLVGGRDFPSPNIGNDGGNYRNVGGGGMEKFFNMDRVVEGPNSFSRNQRRGFERNFHVNSNSGYERNNQWAANTLRRLDAQSSKDAFSKDFIDVFRDDY